METDKALAELVSLLAKEKTDYVVAQRNEKLKEVLLLIAGGAALTTALVAPGTARLFRGIDWSGTDKNEWKQFNSTYLYNTIRRLEKQKIVEVKQRGDRGIIKLTDQGKTKILEMGLADLTISKPARWDHLWRLVFYDVLNGKTGTRDRLRTFLKAAGFFQFQESVYLQAYPCEKEVEFLRHYLGIAGEVRLVVAIHIEKDEAFRQFFGV